MNPALGRTLGEGKGSASDVAGFLEVVWVLETRDARGHCVRRLAHMNIIGLSGIERPVCFA